MELKKSIKYFEEAQMVIPGGVNSPVRAFKSVGGNPIFIDKAKGAHVYDVDGNEYIEMINSWGPMILGHAHPMIVEAVKKAANQSLSFGAPTYLEVEMAQLIIDMVPSIEKVRMVNSGTEATMSAIRVARGYTGKDKIIKFEGCYHGHGDSFLIAAGSGAVTMGHPNSPGVTTGTAKDTLLAPFNDLVAVEKVVNANKGMVAAIILEPVAGNMGCVPPEAGFLQGLRALADAHDIVLIFDEVMTGFRLAKGGAQELYGVTPDLTTLGKIIGGGLPVGAYGGKKEIMDTVSPVGPVYQAGTLSGNPLAMSAGFAMLSYLNENPAVYTKIAETTSSIVIQLQDCIDKNNYPLSINHLGSMYTLFFGKDKVVDFKGAQACDMKKFAAYFQKMLQKGVYMAPSQYESLFISTAIEPSHIEHIVKQSKAAFQSIFD